jgi:hypothetical protein
MMFGDLAAQGGNFILGMCVLIGAAFVYQRSRRAALFVALAGLAYALAVPLELFVERWGFHVAHGMGLQLLFLFIGVTRHLVFFGGIVFGMRTIAKESA